MERDEIVDSDDFQVGVEEGRRVDVVV